MKDQRDRLRGVVDRVRDSLPSKTAGKMELIGSIMEIRATLTAAEVPAPGIPEGFEKIEYYVPADESEDDHG